MHVFVDTNILLNFFHYSKDELDALNDVFATHEHGSATVYLTEQIQSEFRRNRERRIKDALKKFESSKFAPQFPSFLKAYEEYTRIRDLSNELETLRKSLMEKVSADVMGRNLISDNLIGDIFVSSEILETTSAIFEVASRRVALGNPPGKDESLGDAVNWTILLEAVPAGEDLHLISEDGDYFSALEETAPHPYLADEWHETKGGVLFVYRTLSAFMGEHFDGVAFSFDKDKDALIDELAHTGAFATTHGLIAKLENYAYFSLKEVVRILDAAAANDQFGWIVTDYDVSDFLNRVAVPYMHSLNADTHRQIIQEVIDEQKARNDA